MVLVLGNKYSLGEKGVNFHPKRNKLNTEISSKTIIAKFLIFFSLSIRKRRIDTDEKIKIVNGKTKFLFITSIFSSEILDSPTLKDTRKNSRANTEANI